MSEIIPMVLFAYARPEHLQRTLACLHEKIRLLSEPFVEVRNVLHQIDWCVNFIIERENNLNLDTSIMTGVSEIFQISSRPNRLHSFVAEFIEQNPDIVDDYYNWCSCIG